MTVNTVAYVYLTWVDTFVQQPQNQVHVAQTHDAEPEYYIAYSKLVERYR